MFALAIVCGIGFSLAPALRATKADVTPALKEGSTLQLPGYRRFGLRNLLMVAQIAGIAHAAADDRVPGDGN